MQRGVSRQDTPRRKRAQLTRARQRRGGRSVHSAARARAEGQRVCVCAHARADVAHSSACRSPPRLWTCCRPCVACGKRSAWMRGVSRAHAHVWPRRSLAPQRLRCCAALAAAQRVQAHDTGARCVRMLAGVRVARCKRAFAHASPCFRSAAQLCWRCAPSTTRSRACASSAPALTARSPSGAPLRRASRCSCRRVCGRAALQSSR